MTKNQCRRLFLLACLGTTAASVDFGTNRARADFGYGFGFGAFNYTTNQGDFLNQRALSGQRAARPPSNSVYADNPNSYLNRVRDNGFIPHYSPLSRWSPDYQPVRPRTPRVTQTSANAPQQAPQQGAMMPAVPRPVVPIGSFFNAARMLVWPSDAPVDGDLMGKRNISDQACLEVADLVGKHGAAPITTVTSTRQKLLDYGQPALHFMRTHTTSRVAETFHLFLLSLYESLAQAANPL
jgi:hypothetical protein